MEIYLDQSRPFSERAADLVSHMTLEEKIPQLGCYAPAIPRLNVRAWNWWNEASHGVIAVFQNFTEATSFPTCLAMSQTWDPELIEKVSGAISDEMRALYNQSGKELDYWCPTVNMGRDPRWGRNDEAFGEDPFLAGKLAAAYVRGIQGKDPKYLKAVSTPKHFAVNNSEYNRNSGTSNVDEATLREYYLSVFERAVREGGAYSIMTSYNRINGVPASASTHLLKDILRDEWGFAGYVVSDAGAVADVGPNRDLMYDQVRGHFYAKSMPEACAVSLEAGTDLSAGKEHEDYLMDAIRQDMIDENTIDQALIRLFTARFRLGDFDDAEKVPFHSIPIDKVCCPEHAALAEKAAEESLVLMKNNGMLPLDAGKYKKIAVIGPNAIYRQMGSYSIGSNPRSPADTRACVPPLGGIKAEAEKLGVEIVYNKGWNFTNRPLFDLPGSEALLREAKDAGKSLEEYLKDRLPDEVRERQEKMREMFEKHKDDPLPPRRHPVTDAEEGKSDDELLSAALESAKSADAVVVIAGTDPSVTSEGRDRATLALPYDQDEKIQKILKANPNTAVVCVSVGPTIGGFIEKTPALIWATYAGESQGTAIGQVLFGIKNPSGRSTETWYRSDDCMPHLNEYGVRVHDTATQMGRTYLYYLGDVLFPFGHGLSYTKFDYSNFRLSSDKLDANDTLTATIDVTNAGKMAGTDILELYARKINCYDNKPYKELYGFARADLKPGETKTVSVDLPLCELRFWNYPKNAFCVEPGDYRIWFGRSCGEDAVIASGDVAVSGKWNAPLSAVALESDRYILKAGETANLSAAATLMDATHLNIMNENIIYKTSDASVAAPCSCGRIEALGEGACTITASLTRGGVTKSASVPIRVL